MSDAELCAATGAGRTAAFVELVKRYQGAVCAVTWALTGRQDLSEDLAQETFVIAWNKLPQLEAPDRVGPWLTGIARNLGRRAVRDARTVPLPEDSLPDARVGESAADLESAMARKQEQQRLQGWLDSLPDTTREAMVLHYREGLAAPRVAELLGISVAAAEQRLSRGRKQMRDKAERSVRAELRRTRPTDRFTRKVAAALPVAPGLVPGAESPGAGPSAAAKKSPVATLATLSKAVVMNKLILALFAVVTATSLAYVLQAPDAPTESATAEPDRPASPAPSPSDRPAAEPETGIIAGVVSAQDGAPAPGAAVVIARADGQVALTHRRGELGLAIARVDDQGQWRVTGLAPGTYRASATAPGHLPAAMDDLVLTGDPLEGVTLTLSAGGRMLSGEITDIVGGPIEGALVRAKSRGAVTVAAVTDADGRYSLSVAPGHYSVYPWEASYQSDWKNVSVTDADRVLDMTLVPGASISGRVLDRTSGEPVPGAAVSFKQISKVGRYGSTRTAQRHERTVTDDRGRFTLRQLTSANYQLFATASHRASIAPTELDLAIAEQLTDVVVFVDAARDITGRVVDEDNPEVGLAGVEVQVAALGEGPSVYATTEADGAFALHGVVDGEHMVYLRGVDFVPEVGTELSVAGADIEGHVFEAELGTVIRGVIDPPQAVDVRLELAADRGGMEHLTVEPKLSNARGRSAPDGSFELRQVPRGRWRVVAEGDDGSYGETLTEVKGAVEGLRVGVDARPSVRGRLVDAKGAALPEVTVKLTEVTNPDPESFEAMVAASSAKSTMSGPDGGFRFVGLEPGSFELSAAGRDGMPWALSAGASPAVEVSEGPLTGIVLAVERPDGTVRGRVLDAEREPVADAWVSLFGEGIPMLTGSRPPTVTDADGQFEFTDVARGAYSVRVSSARGDANGAEEGVEVGANLELVLESLGGIEGRVTVGGRPVRQFNVELVGSLFDRNFISDEGAFTVARLEQGPQAIIVTAPEGSARVPVTIAEGETLRPTVELTPWGRVRGRAVDEAGSPMGGVLIEIMANGGERDGAARMAASFAGDPVKTADDGTFLIEGIGAGVLSLTMSTGPQHSRESVGHGGVLTELEAGDDLDLGDVRLLGTDLVDEKERGTFGFETRAAVAAPTEGERHWREDLPGAAPALWIQGVDPRGPAAAAGVRSGERVVGFEGESVDDLGPMLLSARLMGERLRRGQTYTLTILGADGERTVELTAGAPLSGPW